MTANYQFGEGHAELKKLLPLVYDELHRLANANMRRERHDHTLQTTALVHEAYLRLVGQQNVQWQTRAHFFAVAARVMRNILVDHARGRGRAKRGEGLPTLPLGDVAVMSDERAGVLISGVVNPALKKYNGKTVAEMAMAEGKEELDALFDFVLADNAQTGALYFMASEDDLLYGLKQPWTSIGLDASESPLDGPLYEPQTHPRAYGSMPRFLGRYVRDQKLMTLTEAIRKITSMPAQRHHLVGRGQLQVGYFADITIFDPVTIIDRATYTEPTKLSEGIGTVLVNGQIEYEQGALTGVNAGRPLRGPGWTGKEPVRAANQSGIYSFAR